MYKYILPSAAILSALILLPIPAQAGFGTNSSTLNVSLTIDPSCTFEAASTALAFPKSVLMNADIDATATLKVRCVAGTKYAVSLGQGNNTNRRLRLGTTTNYIDYELYTDSARTQPWPTTAPAATDYPLTGTGVAQDIPIYGRALLQSSIPAQGAYTDAVLITVSY